MKHGRDPYSALFKIREFRVRTVSGDRPIENRTEILKSKVELVTEGGSR
jgi:hypothetical protein